MGSTWICENCGGQAAVGARMCTRCGRTFHAWEPDGSTQSPGSAPAPPSSPPVSPTPPNGDFLGGGAWDPSPQPPIEPPQRESPPAPPQDPWQKAQPGDHRSIHESGRGEAIEGMVRGVQMRTEQRSDTQSVLMFRLERYDNSGKRVMLVPVEMRGIGFIWGYKLA